MNEILNKILADGLEQLKQLYDIRHIYYGIREYEGPYSEPYWLDFKTQWQVIFVDAVGTTAAINITDDNNRTRTNILLITLACLKVFQENELDFPFWSVVYSNTDWDLVHRMIETTMHVVTMANACILDAFEPPEEEPVKWNDLTLAVSEDWFGCGSDLEKIMYFIEHS